MLYNRSQQRKMISCQKMDIVRRLSKKLMILGLLFYFPFIYISYQYTSQNCLFVPQDKTAEFISTPTNLSHLVFGLVGSVDAWHNRKSYIESWWRPNVTRGFLLLDKAPDEDLLPWSPTSPPYRVSDNLTTLYGKSNITARRIIHAIMETFREDHENLRWLVMGDDDSMFFVDNMVDVLAQYDHTKYYYIGGHSEFIMSSYWFSFNQAFGGAGIILSYPLAKALADDMENCLMRYKHLNAADTNTQNCAADFGVSLTALQGIHQIDLCGEIWGYLSAHPSSPLLSLHHFDVLTPLFPTKNRYDSAHHLMKAASFDQSRMLQQTICYHRPSNWSFSISWGYSAQIYERIMPRSYLKMPLETFDPWVAEIPIPRYMFNTRHPSKDPCEAPHVFFYKTIGTTENEIMTNFTRARPRNMTTCSSAGNHSADSISTIVVHSPAMKRFEMDRSECCDVIGIERGVADVKFRECTMVELIA